jgi:hypothetical protein
MEIWWKVPPNLTVRAYFPLPVRLSRSTNAPSSLLWRRVAAISPLAGPMKYCALCNSKEAGDGYANSGGEEENFVGERETKREHYIQRERERERQMHSCIHRHT